MTRVTFGPLATALVVGSVLATPLTAQHEGGPDSHAAALERIYPDLYDLLVRIERVHGIAFGALFGEGETVRASGEDVPTFGFEFDLVDRLISLVRQEGRLDELADEAAAGYAMLGEQAATIISRTNAFHREVLGILADPAIPDRRSKQAALEALVAQYEAEPGVALPMVPKDMDILYDHPHALDFKTGYLDVAGFIWAGYWLKVAVTEPMTDLPFGDVQAAGVDTVTNRYFDKLTYGEPPQYFPSELTQTPPIAPGIVSMDEKVGMIWDNLSFMQEVLADILATPDQIEVRAALDEAVTQFVDPTYRPTTWDDWELMGLRHGIFFQGGYPLAVMTESELNVNSHAAHLSGGSQIILSGMP